ncbi:NepR family anti-sigma factor [Sinorhizobium chiapasense]|uniref:NepR family anti-sigma factor n=1 Tax=Sinorhizobium chiapasense TaxID=501572 RepID=A0ABZ2B575_9HYPH
MRYNSGAGRPIGTSSSTGDPNAQIAAKLKALYQSVQEEAIPARFLDLLEKLDAAEQHSTLQGRSVLQGRE